MLLLYSRRSCAAAAVVALWGVSCASGVETKPEDDGTATVAATGGSTAGSGGATGGSGGTALPCGVDCTAIDTPPCLQSVCNDGMYPGAVGECVIVPAPMGAACDDQTFCTIDDACDGRGTCVGGPPNDCGLMPGDCDETSCDETSQSCSLVPKANGTICTNTTDLCLVNTTCSNGQCLGQPKDCFFQPVPNDCHVSVCNPQNGMCEPQPGNEGMACTDAMDLCTVGKTCSAGQCVGGSPKDCSAQTIGCFNGVCDTTTGQCVQQPIMPGMQCAEATDQCNVGICDMNGMCNPQPANQGMACNDYQNCTIGDVCNNGACVGTSTITQCIDNDLCCPQGCDINNDNDCSFCDWNPGSFPIAYSGSSVGDMAFDNNCNLYFSGDGGEVRRVNHNTSTFTVLHDFNTYARGVAFNPNDGLLYVAVYDKIYSMTPTGANVTQLPNSTIGSFVQGMEVAPNGWGSYGGWLVVARSTGAVHLVNPASPSPTNVLGTTTGNISDVVFDEMNGVLYVAAYGQNAVLTLSPSGTFSTFASTPCSPDGLAIDPGSFVFISCGSNDQVHKLAIPGGAATLVSTISLNGSWAPAGLLYDGLDNLIVMQESPAQLAVLTP